MRLGWGTVRTAGIAAAALCCVFATPPPSAPDTRVWEKPIAPGLVLREEVDFKSHHSVFAMRLSLQSTAVRPLTALAGGKTYKRDNLTSRLPVSKIVADESALGGVNGDFFSFVNAPSGDPLGIAVRDGRLLSTPSNRIAFGWGPVEAKMAFAGFSGSVETKNGNIKIDGINRRCPKDEITLNTFDVGEVLADKPYVQARIRLTSPVWSPSTAIRGRVISVTSEPDNGSIGPNEAILTARGNKIDTLNQLRAGTDCYIKLKTSGFDWEKIDSVIGGGPMLVKNGDVNVDGSAEGFGKEFIDSRHPRTAIGRTGDNDLWIVAVDGRQETGDGMTLDELAHLMQRMGCVDAINLDGGGSTTMNVLGVTVNRPSDGKERAVADAVVITGPKPPTTNGRLEMSLPQSMTRGQSSSARILENGTAVPDIQVIWGATGACAVDPGGEVQALHSGTGTITAFCHGKIITQQISVD